MNLYELIDNQETTEVVNNSNENNLLCLNCMTSLHLSFDIEYNQYICLNCGFIIPSIVTNKKEPKDYNNNSTSSLDAKGLINYNSNYIKNTVVQNIIKWNKTTIKEVEDLKIKKYIIRKCEELKIKRNIIDDVLIFYKIVINNNYQKNRQLFLRGPNKIGLIGSCIYYAFKKNNTVISIRTISKTLHIATRVINKMCNVFLSVINRLNEESKLYNYNFNISVSNDYLDTFINLLNLKEEDIGFIKHILDNVENNSIFDNLLPHHKAILSVLTYLKKEKYGFKQQIICKIFCISRNLLITLIKLRNEHFDYLYYDKKPEKNIIKVKHTIKKDDAIIFIKNINIDEYNGDISTDYLISCFNV